MNEKTSENKSVSVKRINIRVEKWFGELVQTTMREQKLKTVTEAMHFLLRELEILKEQQQRRENPEIETDLQKDLEQPFPPCDLRVLDTQTNHYECLNLKPRVNLKHFSKSGLQPQVCIKCKSVKIVEKATDNRRKTVKKPRLEYIYCEAEGMKIPIDANQGKCRRCNLNNFRKWAECQEKHRQMEVAYQNGLS